MKNVATRGHVWRTIWLLICLLLCGVVHADKVTYIYTDPNGTILAEADEHGNITKTFDYRPYGEQTLGQPPNGPGYTGHVNDPDTGLVYMQGRYYDPETGRFLSVDPVGPTPGDVFGFNRYAYANNNPIGNVDPNGRQTIPLANRLGTDDPNTIRNYLIAQNEIVGNALSEAHRLTDPLIGVQPELSGALDALEALPMVLPRVLGATADVTTTASEVVSDVPAATAVQPVSPIIHPAEIAGKTPAEIDAAANKAGLISKGPDPMNGKGAYVDPVTGEQRILSHPNTEVPHAHVNDANGQRLDINGNPVPPESPAAHLPLGQ